MTNNDVTLAMLNSVAIKLGSLIDESILVGGTVTGFLVTDALVGDFRATDDVDLVFEIGTRLEYYKLEETLRSLGLSQDSTEHAPICRWVINGIKVDIMPTNTAVLGFENLWYDEAFKEAILITLSPGMNIKIISAPYFIATKLEAYKSRGNSDYMTSHDMEDIVTIINGRKEIVDELQNSEQRLRNYVSEEFRNLLKDEDFLDAIEGYLNPDAASQARSKIVITRMQEIGKLGMEENHSA